MDAVHGYFQLALDKESSKLTTLGAELGFAGHIVSQNGIRPDVVKYKAIKEFPTPKNLKDLANQLGGSAGLEKK